MRALRWAVFMALFGVFGFAYGPSVGAQTLNYATQTPKSASDYRKEIPTITAEELAKAKAGVELKIHYDGELVSAAEMWRAVSSGAIDVASVFLPTAGGVPSEALFNGLPALLSGIKDIDALMASPAMKLFGDTLRGAGGVLLGGYWDLIAIGSTGDCITKPEEFNRLAVRGPGRAYDMVYASQGGISVPLPSPEMNRALRTGAVDAVMSTLSSITLGDGHKYLKCVTDPTVAVPGMVFVATVMSVKAFDALPAERQQAVLAAGKAMSARVQAEANKASDAQIAKVRKDGIKVIALSPEDVAAWRAAAEGTAWAQFRKASPAANDIMTAAAAAVAR